MKSKIFTTVILAALALTTPLRAAAPTGLNALSDDRLMTELAGRGMESLLVRLFEVNKVSPERQDAIRSYIASRELLDGKTKLTYGQKQELVHKIVNGIKASLESQKDPQMLMQLAAALIENGTDADVNKLEYWGENPRTQAELRPVAEAVVNILDKCAVEASAEADRIANTFGNAPSKSQVDAWQQMDTLHTYANYTKAMSTYYLVLAMDPADPQRKTLVEKAIEQLAENDNHESQIQAAVRNRIGKLNMAIGDYDAARKAFESVYNNPQQQILPEPTVYQQYEARYFAAVCDLLQKNVEAARKSINSVVAWQQANFDKDAKSQDGVRTAASMLEYRLNALQGQLAKTELEKNEANNKAMAVLMTLLKERPELRAIIYEQLMNRLPENADLAQQDTLLLQALVQRGETERTKKEGQPFDKKNVERAIDAAKEIVARKGKPGTSPELLDAAAILIPAFREKLGEHEQAVAGYLDFIGANPNSTNAGPALGNAMALLADLRKQSADDPKVNKLLDRFFPLAIGKPFNRKELAYEYARRLQEDAKVKEAIEYYAMVPKDDSRYLYAQFYTLSSLRQLAEEQGKGKEAERTQLLTQAQALAAQLPALAQAALQKAGSDAEKKTFQQMAVQSTLLAARLSHMLNEPQKTLDLLHGFEDKIQSMPNQDNLMGDALYLRVRSYMALGQNTKATEAHLSLLKAKGGAEGAEITFTLLRNLDDEFEAARKNDDQERMKKLAEARAALSGPLVQWAKNNSDQKIRQYTYRYMVFDATTKTQLAELESGQARTEALNQARQLWQQLLAPEGIEMYRSTLPADQAATANYGEPVVLLNLALINFEQKDWTGAQKGLGKLLEDRKLGTPRIFTTKDGQSLAVDNDQYWEATYKLYYSNFQLGRDDPGLLQETKNGLKRLYIREGKNTGGKRWGEKFDELRKQFIPEFTWE